MSLKKLVNPGAFGQGAQLWIIPDPETSSWGRKIDWYLNLQIRRARGHQSPVRSPDLVAVLEKNALNLPVYQRSAEFPLLVSSHDHLPSRSVLQIPPVQSASEWLGLAIQYWQKLKEPTVRLFLPEFISEEFIVGEWPRNKQYGVSYVLSQSPVEGL